MRIPRFTFTVLLAGSLLATAAHAGAYLESTYKKLDGEAGTSVSKMWFDGGRMRTENTQSDGERQIILGGIRTCFDSSGR